MMTKVSLLTYPNCNIVIFLCMGGEKTYLANFRYTV